MLPRRPLRHQVRVGDQHARRIDGACGTRRPACRTARAASRRRRARAATSGSPRSIASCAPPCRCRRRRRARRGSRRPRGRGCSGSSGRRLRSASCDMSARRRAARAPDEGRRWRARSTGRAWQAPRRTCSTVGLATRSRPTAPRQSGIRPSCSRSWCEPPTSPPGRGRRPSGAARASQRWPSRAAGVSSSAARWSPCDETIAWVGADGDLPASLRVDEEIDLGGALVTPGLVDCHTHLVYAGQRAGEFEQRLEGASYEDIARAGGGIRSTVAATRAASDEALFAAARERALALMAEGVTTLEIKSGYGLSAEHEARCLRVARRLGRALPVSVRTTCLSAHALPPEFAGRADDYIDAVCAWLPALHAEGLVDAVDAFCERIAFSVAQTRRVFAAARALGLPVKLHAEQLSDSGGAALAAEFGALSCDHLEYLGAAGVRAMAAAGSVAVLLPGAYYFLRETKEPPVAALREAGVPIAIATDHNPGSSPTLSPLLMLSMACTLFRLTPEEALARHDGQRRARARPRRPRHGRSRDSAPTSRSGTSRIRTSWRTGSASTRARASSSAASNGRHHERSDLHARARDDAAPPEPAARRHRDPRRHRSGARSARARARGHRLAPRRGLRLRARARREHARAALLALRDRPQPAARERADVSRREQHRARADALLQRRSAVPSKAALPTKARSSVGARSTGVPTTTRSPASSLASSPRTGTRSSGTATASRPSCRGCSKVACPISTSAPRAARAARRRCAPR